VASATQATILSFEVVKVSLVRKFGELPRATVPVGWVDTFNLPERETYQCNSPLSSLSVNSNEAPPKK